MGAEEMCVIVDEDNNIVGAETRRKTVSQRLWGRGVYCLVFNKKNQLLVQKRSNLKDIYPGHLDVVVAGVVNAGEEYEDTMMRELEEELGIVTKRESLERLFVVKYEDEFCRVWGCAFRLVLPEEAPSIVLQAEEVDWSRWMCLEEVRQMAAFERFSPAGLFMLQQYLL